MCLQKVTQEYNKTSNRLHIGYKVFETVNDDGHNDLKFRYYHQHFDDSRYGQEINNTVPQKIWLKAKQHQQWDASGRPYTTGFHIFLNWYDADKWAQVHCYRGNYKILKVGFKNVTAKGEDECNRMPVVVAQEMWVSRKALKNG